MEIRDRNEFDILIDGLANQLIKKTNATNLSDQTDEDIAARILELVKERGRVK